MTAEEKELSKQQKTLGAIAHLTLQDMEGYSCLYRRLNDLVLTTFSIFFTARRGQTWPVRIGTEVFKSSTILFLTSICQTCLDRFA